MNTITWKVRGGVLAIAAGFSLSFGSGPAQAEPAGFVPNSPAVWCKFDGDVREYGTAKAQWIVRNAPVQAETLYLSGKYASPLIATGVPNPKDDGSRATCRMADCSLEHYTVAVRYKRDPEHESRMIVLYGTGMRWFAIQPSSKGGLEVVFNNGRFNTTLTGVEVRPEDWNWVVCTVDVPARLCTAYVNGKAAAPVRLPADFTIPDPPAFVTRKAPTPGQFDPSWGFTNLGNQRTFCGWIDEFLVYSRTLNPAELAGLAQRKEMLDPKLPETKRPTPAELEPASKISAAAADATRFTAEDLQEHPGSLAIDSVGMGDSNAARMSGTVSWSATKVKVHIAKGEIVRTKNGDYPERDITSYQLVLRRENPAQKWMDIVAQSERMPIELTITKGTQVAFEDTDVEIPLPGVPAAELGQMWLGVFIHDAFERPDPKTGEVKKVEGLCVAQSKTRLNGTPVRREPVAAK